MDLCGFILILIVNRKLDGDVKVCLDEGFGALFLESVSIRILRLCVCIGFNAFKL